MHRTTRISCALLAFLLMPSVSALGQEKSPQNISSYMPRLGDVMARIQFMHSKLWYSGSLKNWALANYELTEFSAALQEAKRFYPDMSAASLSATDQLTTSIGDSLREKNDSKF